MKLRFLDAKNCHAILPQVPGLRIVGVLDAYLGKYVNDLQGELYGSVDKLIRHNENTIQQARGTKRLVNSPIMIALIYNIYSREINVSGIKSPVENKANFQIALEFENGITWKIIVPLQFLLKGWGNVNQGFQGYVHSISYNISRIKSFDDMQKRWDSGDKDFQYVGITGRNWLLRFREHMGETAKGSRRRFYRVWRESMGKPDIHFISQLGNVNMTYKEAMNWEEYHVDQLGKNRLNMIPGGFKGLKFLHEHRLTDNINISLEERDKAIIEYIRQNPRKGVPNPFIAELWTDDDFYLKVIEARQKTLSPEQVREIRKLSELGHSTNKIKEDVGALNEIQVKNVISGKYYSRIK